MPCATHQTFVCDYCTHFASHHNDRCVCRICFERRQLQTPLASATVRGEHEPVVSAAAAGPSVTLHKGSEPHASVADTPSSSAALECPHRHRGCKQCPVPPPPRPSRSLLMCRCAHRLTAPFPVAFHDQVGHQPCHDCRKCHAEI